MPTPVDDATPAERRRPVLRVLAVAIRVVPILGIIVAVGTWSHLPHMRMEPAIAGLACWTVGNYLFCPLRWRQVSSRGQSMRWYARVYAEGELLGMLTPQHAGADLWRIRQLVHHTGAEKSAAVVEVAADRLAGGVMVFALAVVAGMDLPARFWPAAGGALALFALLVWAGRRRWANHPAFVARPRGWAFARGALVSAIYQAGYLGFMLGLVAAVGHHASPVGAAGVLGLSQAASLLPGIHGAGPKEGAMTGGLVALGLPLSAALAAVALGAALAWLPAVLMGGGGLAVRGIRGRLAVRGIRGRRAAT